MGGKGQRQVGVFADEGKQMGRTDRALLPTKDKGQGLCIGASPTKGNDEWRQIAGWETQTAAELQSRRTVCRGGDTDALTKPVQR
jgi:hypothetical protein